MRAICRRHTVVPSLLVLITLVFPSPVKPAGAATDPSPPTGPSPATAQEPDPYADPARWVCHPDTADVCDRDLDATVVQPDGSTTVERWAPASSPPIDCFYVYPTVSYDFAYQSDLDPYEEILVTRTQAARMSSRCRMFTPVYRQITATWVAAAALGQSLTGNIPELPSDLFATAYADVLAAFRHYLNVENQGRGFVIVGHSQGAMLLSRLLENEIEPSPDVHRRLVSALLIGPSARQRPRPASTPPCTSPGQLRCVVTFSAFRAAVPPAPGSYLAHPAGPTGCVNPAAPGGGRVALRTYFPTSAKAWWGTRRAVTTPFVTLPGLVEGECVDRDGVGYLAITVNGDPSDLRTDDIPGDSIPELGLHLSEMQLVLGDLVELVGQQGSAYAAASGR